VTDHNTRLEVVKNVITNLAIEFGVDKPTLTLKHMSKLHGFYAIDVITLNSNTLHNNLSMAIKAVRHEFCHYLDDILNLPNNNSELKARRFEKNILSLSKLPISQTTLEKFGVVDGRKAP